LNVSPREKNADLEIREEVPQHFFAAVYKPQSLKIDFALLAFPQSDWVPRFSHGVKQKAASREAALSYLGL